MKKEKISFNYRRKKISILAKRLSFFGRFTGLMFTKKENAKALLFDFKKPTNISIHSWFVFFPFIALWLDDKNKIIKIKIVKPFSLPISPEKKFTKLVEIPLNNRFKKFKKYFS